MSWPTKCQGCGEPIQHPPGSGRRRKWCSNTCRRRALYTTPCKTCGVAIYDGSTSPPDECGECKHERLYGERNELMLEMWEAGEPSWYIAEQIGISERSIPTRISWHRQRRGDVDVPLRRHRDRELWPEILDLRAAGLKPGEIAERVGMTPVDIYEYLKRMRQAGVEVPR